MTIDIHPRSRVARLQAALAARSQADTDVRQPLRDKEAALVARQETVNAAIASARWGATEPAAYAALLAERDLLAAEITRVRAAYPPADSAIAAMAATLREWEDQANRALAEIRMLEDTARPETRRLTLEAIEARLTAARATIEHLISGDFSTAPHGITRDNEGRDVFM